MSHCINPRCPNPTDPGNALNIICSHCGSDLLLAGHYRVRSLLSGDSGFGDVYEADDILAQSPKILKVLKPHLNAQAKAVDLFQKEAQVLSQLNHPGIPRVDPHGYFTFRPSTYPEALHCLVMERIEGLNLEQWMHSQSSRPISEDLALDWLGQLGQILDRVHSCEYFHRDIKPSNIMLRPNGELVLIDFGTAREVTNTYLVKVSGVGNITKLTSAGYTPPEQEKGHAVPQSDFYALGRTFVYLLTGKHPTDNAVYDPMNDELRWRAYAAHISPRLADFIDYLMAAKAGQRPPNTQVILQQVAEIKQPLSPASTLQVTGPNLPPIPGSGNSGPPTRILSTSTNSHVALLTGTAIVLLMGLTGVSSYWVYSHHFSNPPVEPTVLTVPPDVMSTALDNYDRTFEAIEIVIMNDLLSNSELQRLGVEREDILATFKSILGIPGFDYSAARDGDLKHREYLIRGVYSYQVQNQILNNKKGDGIVDVWGNTAKRLKADVKDKLLAERDLW
ncbi:MAG: serine/threonine protein kinase [Hormoscilla sp.]